MTPTYRSDIDGLRAIAVLVVVLFHSGLDGLGGGYVGVDIFFVISGFLITGIIVRELGSGDFSIVKFYERRCRRILPALVVVVMACVAVGYLLLTPEASRDLGESVVATALFSSNMLFFFESGYFDRAAELKPLLHTWSLAVEEQYYLFFPMLLVLIAKLGKAYYARWLISLGLISFTFCIVLTGTDPSAAFYWIPSRGWELLVGSVIALQIIPRPENRLLRETCSFSGAILLAYSVLRFTPETPFPGVAAAVPIFGAALIIYSGTAGSSLVSRALSLRPLVFIGLISYSLYLWHWPILVYAKIYLIEEPSLSVKALMLLCTFIISALSWRFVETPFRKKALLGDRARLFGFFAVVSVALVASGSLLISGQGSNKPVDHRVDLGPQESSSWVRWNSCGDDFFQIDKGENPCSIGEATGKTRFIVWGDSHAGALADGIDLSAKKSRLKGILANQTACPPLLGIERRNRTSCSEFNQHVLDFVSQNRTIETVILVGRWALSTKGTRYKEEPGDPVYLVNVEDPDNHSRSNLELFQRGLRNTVNTLRGMGKDVVLVNPIPEVGYDVPSALVIAKKRGLDVNDIVAPTLDEYRERTREVRSVFDKLQAQSLVNLVTPETFLCDGSTCKVSIDDTPLYRDDDHLSIFGSEFVSQAFDKIFEEMRP